MRVPENQRRIFIQKIDALFALNVRDPATATAARINRIGGQYEGVPRVATGHHPRCTLVELPRRCTLRAIFRQRNRILNHFNLPLAAVPTAYGEARFQFARFPGSRAPDLSTEWPPLILAKAGHRTTSKCSSRKSHAGTSVRRGCRSRRVNLVPDALADRSRKRWMQRP